MKALFIGGTGNISTAVSRQAIEIGIDLYHLNRGQTPNQIKGVKTLKADINKPEEVKAVLAGHKWDVVVNWIAFNENDILRDYDLFRDNCSQYIFISSASVYQKPLTHPVITESTPIKNPYWDYSQDKIRCEERLETLYRENDFPMVIVRPSLTYDTVIPVAIGSWDDYTIIDRMKKGKPVIIHGDGSSVWTVTHSEDFARGFIGLMGHQQAVGHAFHITSDELLNWNQIYEAVAMAAGVELNAVHIASDYIIKEAKKIDWTWMGGDFMKGNLLGDKAVSCVYDNSKIKTFVPGFKATIPFKEGIQRTVKWFEEDNSRMIIHADNNRFLDTIIDSYLNN